MGVPKRNRRLRMVSRVLGIKITAAEYTKATPDTTDRMMNLKLLETIRIQYSKDVLVFRLVYIIDLKKLTRTIRI